MMRSELIQLLLDKPLPSSALATLTGICLNLTGWFAETLVVVQWFAALGSLASIAVVIAIGCYTIDDKIWKRRNRGNPPSDGSE